jgi:hypothetical protein
MTTEIVLWVIALTVLLLSSAAAAWMYFFSGISNDKRLLPTIERLIFRGFIGLMLLAIASVFLLLFGGE